MIGDAQAEAGRRGRVVPRTEPRTEPRNVFPGSAPGCPCKCTPLAPAGCMTTRAPDREILLTSDRENSPP